MLSRTATRGFLRPPARVRYVSVSSDSRPQPSAAYFDPSKATHPSVTQTPENLNEAQREKLQAALRVDQAGEVAANYIYKGQLAVFQTDPEYGPLIQEMWDQEKKHLGVMNKMQLQHDVRPTILWEVAQVAGYGLGVATALMGKEAAMACTEAVETVIGEHYQDQLKALEDFPDHPSLPLLREVIKEFRDDELEHLDTAVVHNSQRAPAHALLSTVIGEGCKIAIELCKRF